MTEQGTQKRRGCLFYGCAVGAILLLVILVGVFFGVRYARNVVNQLTDTQPMTMPTVQLSSGEMQQLRDRIDDFRTAIQEGTPAEPLALTDREVNALIATDPDLAAFRNHLYVTIEGDQLHAQLSIPAEQLSLDALRGKYINATGTFMIALKDGMLHVNADTLSAKNRPLPEAIMRQIRGQNLAERFNSDPRASLALGKLQDIQVKDGKLILVPKRPG